MWSSNDSERIWSDSGSIRNGSDSVWNDPGFCGAEDGDGCKLLQQLFCDECQGNEGAMTLEDLETLIDGAEWFSRCGEFPGELGAVPLAVVAASADWDWLPTSRDQPDPVHGAALAEQAAAAGLDPTRRAAELAAARRVLRGLRAVPDRVPALVDGP